MCFAGFAAIAGLETDSGADADGCGFTTGGAGCRLEIATDPEVGVDNCESATTAVSAG